MSCCYNDRKPEIKLKELKKAKMTTLVVNGDAVDIKDFIGMAEQYDPDKDEDNTVDITVGLLRGWIYFPKNKLGELATSKYLDMKNKYETYISYPEAAIIYSKEDLGFKTSREDFYLYPYVEIGNYFDDRSNAFNRYYNHRIIECDGLYKRDDYKYLNIDIDILEDARFEYLSNVKTPTKDIVNTPCIDGYGSLRIYSPDNIFWKIVSAYAGDIFSPKQLDKKVMYLSKDKFRKYVGNVSTNVIHNIEVTEDTPMQLEMTDMSFMQDTLRVFGGDL